MIFPIFSWISLLNFGLLFILTLLGSLGLVPGTLIWIASSAAMASSLSDVLLIIIIVSLAAIIGDIIAYEIARKFSFAISSWLSKFKSFQKGEHKARNMLKKHEFSIVFLSRFLLTSLDVIVSYISGFERIDRKKYIIAVILGEILYALMYTVAGFMFKETWVELTSVIGDITWILVFVIITAVVIKILIDRKRKKQ